MGITPYGDGITPHGGDIFKDIGRSFEKAGKDTKRWFDKAGKDVNKGASRGWYDTVRFVTSKPTRQAIKTVRNISTPLVKNLVKQGIQSIPTVLMATPLAPAAPVIQTGLTLAKPGIDKGVDMGIDAANKEIDKTGYGKRAKKARKPRGVGSSAVEAELLKKLSSSVAF